MDDEQEPSGIQVLRLFPLAGVVFFPHSVLPLHIFEPRYRQMTEDALEGDRLVTIVMVRPAAEWQGKGPPKLEEYGCLGRILQHERLPDGRFNFLLLGLRRVRILREVPSGKLYRTAEAEVVEEPEGQSESEGPLVRELLEGFRSYHEPRGGVDPDLEDLISSDLPVGVLADILAHALALPPAIKQRLLAERDARPRATMLRACLRDMLREPGGAAEGRDFPPPFSAN